MSLVDDISPTDCAAFRRIMGTEKDAMVSGGKLRSHVDISKLSSYYVASANPFPNPYFNMFKRVEKRRRRKEEEEELGLDEGMKEVLGMQDTDSDESDSDSDSDSDSEKGFDAGTEAGDEEDDGSEEEGEGGEGKEMGGSELSVEDALEDPVYLKSLDPDIKACIVCPGKVLKHPKMIDVHKASSVCTPQKILHSKQLSRFM